MVEIASMPSSQPRPRRSDDIPLCKRHDFGYSCVDLPQGMFVPNLLQQNLTFIDKWNRRDRFILAAALSFGVGEYVFDARLILVHHI